MKENVDGKAVQEFKVEEDTYDDKTDYDATKVDEILHTVCR